MGLLIPGGLLLHNNSAQDFCYKLSQEGWLPLAKVNSEADAAIKKLAVSAYSLLCLILKDILACGASVVLFNVAVSEVSAGSQPYLMMPASSIAGCISIDQARKMEPGVQA